MATIPKEAEAASTQWDIVPISSKEDPARSRKRTKTERRTGQTRNSYNPYTISYKLNPITVVNHLTGLGIKEIAPEVLKLQTPFAGRTKHFVDNWVNLTQDQWVLESIQGVRIEFQHSPRQDFPPPEFHLNEQDRALIHTELQSMQKKGAIRELPHWEAQGGFSNIFVVPKRMEK